RKLGNERFGIIDEAPLSSVDTGELGVPLLDQLEASHELVHFPISVVIATLTNTLVATTLWFVFISPRRVVRWRALPCVSARGYGTSPSNPGSRPVPGGRGGWGTPDR